MTSKQITFEEIILIHKVTKEKLHLKSHIKMEESETLVFKCKKIPFSKRAILLKKAAISSMRDTQLPPWRMPKQRLMPATSRIRLWIELSCRHIVMAGHKMQACRPAIYARMKCTVKTRHLKSYSCRARNNATMSATKRHQWTVHLVKCLHTIRCTGAITHAANTAKKGIWRIRDLKITITMIFPTTVSFVPSVAQSDDGKLEMEFVVSSGDLVLLFTAFVISVAGVCIFLARDLILRKKTSYDSKEFESKKDKTYEKYHSGWSDDYEEVGARKNTSVDKEFAEAAQNSKLPDYYKVLGLPRDATQEDIKRQYRMLAKKSHPDKTGHGDAKEIMARINEAYEVLSDQETRAKYDGFLV